MFICHQHVPAITKIDREKYRNFRQRLMKMFKMLSDVSLVHGKQLIISKHDRRSIYINDDTEETLAHLI